MFRVFNQSLFSEYKPIRLIYLSIALILILPGIFNFIVQSEIHQNNEILLENGYQKNLDIKELKQSYKFHTFDFTLDSMLLLPDHEKELFNNCFNYLKINIESSIDLQFPKPLSSHNEEGKIEKIDNQLPIKHFGKSEIIRTFSADSLSLNHIFERTISGPSGLKQTLILKNLLDTTQFFQVSFILETHLNYIYWNDNTMKLSTEKNRFLFRPEPSTIILLDNNQRICGSFSWDDLLKTGFTPQVVGRYENGLSIIECQVSLSIEPKEIVTLDPSYLLENVANSKFYNREKYSKMGSAMASGDINNDGYQDLIIAASETDSGPDDDRIMAGEIYIVYGKPRKNFSSYLEFNNSEDVIIYGEPDDNGLRDATLTTGDINHDSFDDLVIGAPTAKFDRGLVYVIYGKQKLKRKIDLGVTSNYDIKITGPQELGYTGTSLAVGDVNGDKFGDIIIGSPGATFYNGTDQYGYPLDREECGMVHIIYGNDSMNRSFKLKDSPQYDIKIISERSYDRLGKSLASGDINNDGIDDIVIGSPDKNSGHPRRYHAGEVDVIFGHSNLPKLWDLRNYENITAAKKGIANANMSVIGAQNRNEIGVSLKVSNLNNDDYDDILIGVPYGKGKTQKKSDVGEIYIIYGDNEKNLMENGLTHIDAINMTRDGYIIYGKDSGDLFGQSLASGDFDGDGINDLLLGAPGARGISDDSDKTGEVYVISGSTEKLYGHTEIETLVGTPELHTFYGKRRYEQSGFVVIADDLDNNGRDEIIISAPESDSLNGTLSSVGRVDILFEYDVVPRIAHKSFKLLDGGGDNGTICYAGHEQTFKVEVFSSLGIKNLNFTQLSLEPTDLNIQFRWSRSNNTFYEVPGSDKWNYAEINSLACTSKKINDTIYLLDFVVIFNFTYPSHQLSSCQLYSLGYNLSIPAAINRYHDIYYVENDLDFVGDLVVTASSQGVLKNGDRVHTNETIIWSGLKVVYNGTTDLYPDFRYFDVTVWDDDGDFWFAKPGSGKGVLIESKADFEDDSSNIHTINITNIAGGGKGLTEFNFEIEVVSTRIIFSNPTPSTIDWQNSVSITCSITIKDESNWKIKGDTIEYSTSTKGSDANSFGPWTSAGETSLKVTFSPSVQVEFENGEYNYIQWRVKNEISDLYSGSEIYQIRIDIESVFYTEPIPDKNTWQYDENVECKILILDNLSGVDLESIQYRYSTTGTSGYGNWIKNTISTDEKYMEISPGQISKGFLCKIKQKFKSGENNFIQWQASDKLGNSQLISDDFKILITTDMPISILKSPKDKSIVNTQPFTLKWSGRDPNADQITYEVYLSKDLLKVSKLDEAAIIEADFSGNLYNISKLENGETYYWTVIPYDGNLLGKCQSNIWSFNIDLPKPICNLILPSNNSIISNNEVVLIWTTDYLGFEKVMYDLYLDTVDPPIQKIKEDILKNNYKYSKLENGKTYYWSIKPKVDLISGRVHGKSLQGIFKFTVNTNQVVPEVILESPKNNSFISNIRPTLQWDFSNNQDNVKNIKFSLFIDSGSIPVNILKTDISDLNYTLSESKKLEYNKTYYWRILPFIDSENERVEGKLSNIWQFQTVYSVPDFSISLTLSKNKITVHPGDTKEIEFTIINTGTISDIFVLSVTNVDLSEVTIELSKARYELSASGEDSGTIFINTPKEIDLNTYTFSISVTSNVAKRYGQEIETEKKLIIKVVEKTEIEDFGLLISSIAIIIILIIIILIVLMLKSKKKPMEEPKITDEGKKTTIKEIKVKDKQKSRKEELTSTKKGKPSGKEKVHRKQKINHKNKLK